MEISMHDVPKRILNEGLQTVWRLRKDKDYFFHEVAIGDRLEMGRGAYRHWAVYVGVQSFKGRKVPCVVHRGNPNDDAFSLGFSSSSASRKNDKGICLEPLLDVWEDSYIRVNNKADMDFDIYTAKEILERLQRALQGCNLGCISSAYDMISNNCEHFATWARNGTATSKQVEKAAETAKDVGTYVALGPLGPFAVAAGFLLRKLL